MSRSESELSYCFHQRARRAMLACLRAYAGAEVELSGQRLAAEVVHEALSVAIMRFVVLSLGRARGLFAHERDFATGRLFAPLDARLETRALIRDGVLCWDFARAFAGAESALHAELEVGLKSDGVDLAACPAELVGNLYELLLGEGVRKDEQGRFELESGKRRKQTGTFFTPRALTEVVVEHALQPLQRRIRKSSHRAHDFVLDFRVCDPAVGGGAFLLEVMRALSLQPGAKASSERRRALVTNVVHGVDLNPIAVAVAEAALCLFVADPSFSLHEAGKNLRVGDALLGPPYGFVASPRGPRGLEAKLNQKFDFLAEFPEVFERGGFDLVVGNPPWVAYAGRAAQPLSPERKAYLSHHYAALRGYPTLHGLFVERALRLAPQGTIALVVPSPIADLQGYRAVRRVVRATHTPCEPMLEFGQDAFASVTQPCFALIAEARTGDTRDSGPDDQAFRLVERQRAGATATEVLAPATLTELASRPTFPRELFGEMGFQTTSIVTQQLLKRAAEPDAVHHYPLLEGRDVQAFSQGRPRLFLAPDRELLSRARCRLRDRDDYARVKFVIRQTARYPIAAKHQGLPFRNSLLAGFDVDGLSPDLVVGLLNSALYRALHLALRRDARQATFPQLKIAHLRALPEPPHDIAQRAEIAKHSAQLTDQGVDAARTVQLDAAVFAIFSIDSEAACQITSFLNARSGSRG